MPHTEPIISSHGTDSFTPGVVGQDDDASPTTQKQIASVAEELALGSQGSLSSDASTMHLPAVTDAVSFSHASLPALPIVDEEKFNFLFSRQVQRH